MVFRLCFIGLSRVARGVDTLILPDRHLNNDSRLDVIVSNYGSNDVSVLLGYGNGSFEDERRYAVGSSPQAVAIGDLNNDHRPDITVSNYESGDVSVLLGHGDGTFEEQTKYAVGSGPFGIAIGDFNKDGRLDIVVTSYWSDGANVLVGYLYKAFEKKTVLLTGNHSRPQSLVIADFNNDGLADIGVANFLTNSIGVFLSYGNMSFANQSTSTTSPYSSPCAIAAGHFDNDTQVDVVFGICQSQNVGVLFGYGNGSFGNLMVYSTGSFATRYSVAVSDLDNDGMTDIVVANYDSNTVGVLRGHGNGTFASIALFPLAFGSEPFAIVLGDFNQDSKLDLVIANNGSDSLSTLLQTC